MTNNNLIEFLTFRKQNPNIEELLADLYDKFNRDLISTDDLLEQSGIREKPCHMLL